MKKERIIGIVAVLAAIGALAGSLYIWRQPNQVNITININKIASSTLMGLTFGLLICVYIIIPRAIRTIKEHSSGPPDPKTWIRIYFLDGLKILEHTTACGLGVGIILNFIT